jgi:hypothetical protein
MKLRHAGVLAVCAVAVFIARCQCGPSTNVCRSATGCLTDGGDAGNPDGGGPDSGQDAGRPFSCTTSAQCPTFQVCLGSTCVPDPCVLQPLACDAGAQCFAKCVPTTNLCNGVTCGVDQTCVGGNCLAGCFPSPCATVTCATGSYCDLGTGACIPLQTCGGVNPCGAGYGCQESCVATDPCQGVTCASDQLCRGGTCIADPCAAKSCDAGDVCSNGTCIATCCTPGCTDAGTCVYGTCQCTPNCTGKTCGMDNGCGGKCQGGCASGDVCIASGPDAGCCAPSCAGKACGAPNGCGGKCGCASGDRCLTDGGCCAPKCSGLGCGADDSCGGQCVGGCASGDVCVTGPDAGCCKPVCTGKACGSSNGCGGKCGCTSGDVCQADGGCCAPNCTGVACGAPNGCGGACLGSCPAGETCSPTAKHCIPSACSPECSCGQVCIGGTCEPLCTGNTTVCGCGSCCSPSEFCDFATGTCQPVPT